MVYVRFWPNSTRPYYNIDMTKSNSPDGISARMLKATVGSITPAVTKLFNMSIKSGKLPNEWKLALVTPIPKSDNKSDPANYCPISLLSILSQLSILSKLLEKHTSSETSSRTIWYFQ